MEVGQQFEAYLACSEWISDTQYLLLSWQRFQTMIQDKICVYLKNMGDAAALRSFPSTVDQKSLSNESAQMKNIGTLRCEKTYS